MAPMHLGNALHMPHIHHISTTIHHPPHTKHHTHTPQHTPYLDQDVSAEDLLSSSHKPIHQLVISRSPLTSGPDTNVRRIIEHGVSVRAYVQGHGEALQ